MVPTVDHQIHLSTSEYGTRRSEISVSDLLESLRRRVHEAVDSAIDELAGTYGTSPDASGGDGDDLAIEAGEEFGRWTYRWPDKQEEEFVSGRWYRAGDLHLRLAWTTRRAWGRERGRAIVFQQLGGRDSTTYYPLAEFVESDAPGTFAAPIPDPGRPRALLSAGAQLPVRFASLRVVRADEAFGSIDNGPSLRLLVAEDDEIQMVVHACWVGQTRGRL